MLEGRRRREVEGYLVPRSRGKDGAVRWYGDFRAFETAGGGREALVCPGHTRATRDKEEALLIADNRLHDLAKLERTTKPGFADHRRLAVLGRKWLRHRARARSVSKQWMKDCHRHVRRAAEFFGPERDLSTIDYPEFVEWHTYLLEEQHHSKDEIGLSESSAHKHLCSMHAVYEHGQRIKILPPAYNPVPPSSEREVNHMTAPHLEVGEMAEVLRYFREDYRPKREDLAVPYVYEITATAALSGGRKSEVTNLRVTDVDFQRKTITFTRRVKLKGGKTKTIVRTVPLYPQLEEILRSYLAGPNAPTGKLLFPQYVDGREQPVGDLRKAFWRVDLPEAIQERAVRLNGIRAEGVEFRLSWLMLRHTYCTARLQTLDHGHPISKHTVMHEMGHKSENMINTFYGHLGRFRCRSEHVEYHVTSGDDQTHPTPEGRPMLRIVR